MDEVNLDEEDVLAMVRLMSDVIGRAGDRTQKKRHLLSGLCEMIRADWWVWGLFEKPTAGQEPSCLSVIEGGAGGEQFDSSCYALHPGGPEQLKPSFFMEPQRRHAHPDRIPKQCQLKKEPAECDSYLLGSAAGNIPAILSRRVAGLNSFSIIGFYRSPEQSPFSSRELRLADIILAEVTWLHEQGRPSARASVFSLPPRQRQTLNLLIRGHSRNEISERLRISIHTVGDYVKAIYRHFGVQSRTELMNRFRGELPDEA